MNRLPSSRIETPRIESATNAVPESGFSRRTTAAIDEMPVALPFESVTRSRLANRLSRTGDGYLASLILASESSVVLPAGDWNRIREMLLDSLAFDDDRDVTVSERIWSRAVVRRIEDAFAPQYPTIAERVSTAIHTPDKTGSERSPRELTRDEAASLWNASSLPQAVRSAWQEESKFGRLARLNEEQVAALDAWLDAEGSAASSTSFAAIRLKTMIRQREIAARSSRSRFMRQATVDGKSALGFEVRVELVGVTRPTWRRLRVPDVALDRMADLIAAAFEWDRRWGHRFVLHGVPFGPWSCGGPFWPVEEDAEDEFAWNLSDLASPRRNTVGSIGAFYLGPWTHEIAIERGMAEPVESPVCLEGEGSLANARLNTLARWRLIDGHGVLNQIDEGGVVSRRVTASQEVANPNASEFDRDQTTSALKRCS